MKKYIYTSITFLFAVIIGLSSCSDDLIKTDYDYQQDESLTLASLALDSLVKVSDESVSLYGTITDKGLSEVYDQGFIYSTDESFTTYSSVSGEIDTLSSGDKFYVKDFNIAQGSTFYFKAFSLTKDGLSTSSSVESINLPVTWEDVGTVAVTDNAFSGELIPDVVIQKFQGRNQYRLINPFDTEAGGYLVFSLDDEWNAGEIARGSQDLGTDPYLFYWDPVNYGQYCSFTNRANVYILEFLLLEGSSLYLADIEFEWVDGYEGEIPEPVEVTYKTDFSDEDAKAGWELDKYSGTGEDDDVWYFDTEELGVSWGTSIAAMYDTESLKITSPSFTVAEDNILSFGVYSGVFGSELSAKVNVYIREEGGAINYDNPVKSIDLAAGEGDRVVIPLEDYEDKTIKVIFVVEQGDIFFYRFAVATSSNASSIF